MALVLNGSANTIAGVAAGGINDNVVDNGTMADDAIGIAELSATGTASSSTYLRGDNTWGAVTSGLTNAQVWRIHTGSSLSSGTTKITSNWEKSDDDATEGYLGSSMTESSGTFTFPATGMWYVKWVPTIYQSGSGVSYFGAQIRGSHDDFSNEHTISSLYNHNRNGSGDNYAMSMAEGIFDCTDTSTDKVAFYVHVPGTVIRLRF